MFRMKALAASVWLTLAGLWLPLSAQSWSVAVDNDNILNSDDHYTGGIQIGWMSNEFSDSMPGSFEHRFIGGISALAGALSPFEFDHMKRNGAISVKGIAITPEDTDSEAPVYDDVPYVGATSATGSLFLWDERLFHEVQLAVGVLGPASGAESAQKGIHRLFRIDEPRGWDNQLSNRLLVQTGYLFGIRQYSGRFAGNYTFEWFNNFNAAAGSIYAGAGAGTALRLGENLPGNFISTSGIFTQSLAEQLNVNDRSGTLGWDVNLAFEVNTIGYFYIYEASKEQGYDFDRPSTIVTGRLGFDLFYETYQLSFSLHPARPIDELIRSNYFARAVVVWWIP
jgi:lipid A 3-O-deacylase